VSARKEKEHRFIGGDVEILSRVESEDQALVRTFTKVMRQIPGKLDRSVPHAFRRRVESINHEKRLSPAAMHAQIVLCPR
jgi:hypothetical protein